VQIQALLAGGAEGAEREGAEGVANMKENHNYLMECHQR